MNLISITRYTERYERNVILISQKRLNHKAHKDMSTPWSRADRLARLGAIVAIVSVIVAVGQYFTPEIRKCLGVESGDCPISLLRKVKSTQSEKDDFPKFSLLPGTYFGDGTMVKNSHREIASSGARICIVLVDGFPSPYEGHPETTISSVVQRNGKYIIESDDSQLLIHNSRSFYDGRIRTTWRHRTTQIGHLPAINSCLESQGKYVKQNIEGYIPGVPLPGEK